MGSVILSICISLRKEWGVVVVVVVVAFVVVVCVCVVL